MELSLSTFVLELINFVVLVWILKRFLYKPVLDIIARRRAQIDETLSKAKRIEEDAHELEDRYEKRLREWESERAVAREKLAHELDDERNRQLRELRSSLDAEIEKSRAAETRRLADLADDLERQGLSLGARFASRLLECSATPELQNKLLDLFLEDFDNTSRDEIAGLIGNLEVAPDAVDVTSAYALTEAQQKAVGERAKTLCDRASVRFDEDPGLLAGIRLTVGGCVLGLNLKDELEGFARITNVGD